MAHLLSFILSTVHLSDLMLSSLFPQDNLLEIVQLVGKESLSEDQKVSLHVQR
jgi:vacuolar-type H+-ATPase catalytic subunit A/Vma1